MAAPVINDLILPRNSVLVLPDPGELPTTGVIVRRSSEGGGKFESSNRTDGPLISYDHVLFVREMTTEVDVDGVEYLAMNQNAVVGLIPD